MKESTGLAKIGVPVDLINGRVYGSSGLQRISVDRTGIVQQVVPMDTMMDTMMRSVADLSKPTAQQSLQVWDLAGDWVSMGGIDLQINGALGLAFPDLTEKDQEKLQEICEFLWNQGVDGFLPTLVTTAVENVGRSLSTITHFMTQQKTGAKILGVHLEGPFLNPQKRGAHPTEYLLPLTIAEVKRVLGNHATTVKMMTLAPELDQTGEVIPYLTSLGISVSLGHSQATAAQAQQAFEQGATLVTHAFNAMPGLHHRQPGLLGAAIAHPQVMCGLIADGEHVAPLMLDILLRASRGNGIFLVSDALSPLGLPNGIYPWDSRQIEVQQGTARLADGTLAGTTLPLLVGVQNLARWSIVGVGEAIALATAAPRLAIGLPSSLVGQPANLLHWSCSEFNDLTWQRL
ncbi:MAG: N-acetylglucosamine-6-phosphate deacetylase [Timaviella obliquedivisa GSE-PSE-MK23-08B]|nr:N-acetylglucosamine-6-phosphate deacetylase [Timaviella obliquedivisa GSE-PSE-MK23-08B]